MQVITNEKWLVAVSGGGEDLDFDDPVETSQDVGMQNVADSAPSASSSRGDQRSPEQIAAQAAVDQGNKACSALPPGAAQTCTQLNNAQGYNMAAQAYTICIATGGTPGPTSCGVKPSPGKLSK